MAFSKSSILVVDDDPAVGKVVGALLSQSGVDAHHASSGTQALELLGRLPIDAVITDLKMPAMDGLELLGEVNKRWPSLPVIVLTAHGTVAQAVEAMKRGAADFVQKPFDREELLFTVRKALTSREDAPDESPGAVAEWMGDSKAMAEVRELIRRASAGTATVLLRGESGVGKERAARAIHQSSPRASAPFVKIHCASLPDTLLESELFGYEKGAFTGAASRKPGRVELAEGGTLFLDEIGDVTPAIQVKLLRVLQDREFERLGGTQVLKANVRFVAATHQPLEELVKKGMFREDLFYRLNVIPILIPPLRSRVDEIEPLAQHFAKSFGEANGKPQCHLDRSAVELLRSLKWPGNVRELQNFVERLVILSDAELLTATDVRRELERQTTLTGVATPAFSDAAPAGTLDGSRKHAEREALRTALDRAGQNRTLAARILGVSRRTLYNKLAEHELV